MAQLVARAVRDCEVASSNLVTQTIQGGKIKKIYFLYLIDAEWKDFAKAKAYHEIILTKIKKDWNDSSLFGYK